MTLEHLEQALGHTFADQGLLLEALTHKTWLKEQHDRGAAFDRRDQQRLEFLGDAFLGYEIGRQVFDLFRDANEGQLTAQRRALVKGAYARQVGEQLGVLGLVNVGRGERSNLELNQKVVEDTVEALIGAVLVDAGEHAARTVVRRLFPVEMVPLGIDDDPVSAYNTLYQQAYRCSPPKPVYKDAGPDNAKTWTATVELADGRTVSGSARNQPAARKLAYQRALLLLGHDVEEQ